MINKVNKPINSTIVSFQSKKDHEYTQNFNRLKVASNKFTDFKRVQMEHLSTRQGVQ